MPSCFDFDGLARVGSGKDFTIQSTQNSFLGFYHLE